MRSVLLLHDELMRRHRNADVHPEAPDRITAIERRLRGAELRGVRWVQPKPALPEDVLRVHTDQHVNGLERFRGRYAQLDGDTGLSPGSLDAAYRSAGGAIAATRAVVQADVDRAFSLGRPPGHHAEPHRAMGFCLFNNIAIAARWAIEVAGLERVLIIDWDVHHGNGTEAAFYEDDKCLFISAHQAPLYPGTGSWEDQGHGRGRGYNLNIPMPAGSNNSDMRLVFEHVVRPVAAAYEPQLILVSAGYDAHAADPLAGQDMDAAGFGELTRIVGEIADEHTGGRFALTLEGGYDLHALAESVLRTVQVLGGTKNALPTSEPTAGYDIVAEAARQFRWRWPSIPKTAGENQ